MFLDMNLQNQVKFFSSKKIKLILIEIDKNFSEHIEVINILKSFDYELLYYKDKNGVSNGIFEIN